MARLIKLPIGETRTRDDIHEIVGGGSLETYLPYRDGKVLCGCFDPSNDMNPHAPCEILFGENRPTPLIDNAARMVFCQGQNGEAIPVFLKRSANNWEYVGDYLCIGITFDERVVRRKMATHPERGGFSGILRFERVDDEGACK